MVHKLLSIDMLQSCTPEVPYFYGELEAGSVFPPQTVFSSAASLDLATVEGKLHVD